MSLTADYDPENEPETPRQAEIRHVTEAERLLDVIENRKANTVHTDLLTSMSTRATAHATLALYYQGAQNQTTTEKE